jgi:hypothetical protein
VSVRALALLRRASGGDRHTHSSGPKRNHRSQALQMTTWTAKITRDSPLTRCHDVRADSGRWVLESLTAQLLENTGNLAGCQ